MRKNNGKRPQRGVPLETAQNFLNVVRTREAIEAKKTDFQDPRKFK